MSQPSKHLPFLLMVVVLALFAFDSIVSTTILSVLVPLHDRGMSFLVFGSFFGLLAGQALLAATWLALGAGPLAIRLPASLTIFALVFLSWFAGMSLTQHLPRALNALLTAAFCLGLFLLVTTPLWITRLGSRRRIIARDSQRALETREQFSLRQLFVATACVALLLTLVKSIFGGESWRGIMDARWSLLLDFLLFALALGAYINLVVWPLLWTILREPRGSVVRWVSVAAGALIVGPILVSETFFVIPGVGRPPSALYPWIMGALLCFGCMVTLVTAGGFFLARLAGLRFVTAECTKTDPL